MHNCQVISIQGEPGGGRGRHINLFINHLVYPALSIENTALTMNMIRNDSVAWVYIIPSPEKSEKSAIVERWNYPVENFELRPYDFLRLTINKEFHVRKSTKGSPCTDLGEETYYEVPLNSSDL